MCLKFCIEYFFNYYPQILRRMSVQSSLLSIISLHEFFVGRCTLIKVLDSQHRLMLVGSTSLCELYQHRTVLMSLTSSFFCYKTLNLLASPHDILCTILPCKVQECKSEYQDSGTIRRKRPKNVKLLNEEKIKSQILRELQMGLDNCPTRLLKSHINYIHGP